MKRISDVHFGSIILFRLGGRFLKGVSWRNARNENLVYVFGRSGRTEKLLPDKMVRVISHGGFKQSLWKGSAIA